MSEQEALRAIEESQQNMERIARAVVAANDAAARRVQQSLYRMSAATIAMLVLIAAAVAQGITQRTQIVQLQRQTLHAVETQCPATSHR